MDPLLLASASFAGAIAIAVTVAIERLGGRAGGLIGTLPSTIVPAAAGIAAQGDPDVLWAAMMSTPAGMLDSALFLWMWRIVPPHLPRWGLGARLTAMLAISLSVWLVTAVVLVTGTRAWADAGLPLEVVGLGGLVGMGLFGVVACWRTVPAPRGHRPVGWGMLVARGAVAAGAIAAAVWLSSLGHGAAAGVASVFPAIFMTTMVSLWVSQGEAVQAGAVGPMMLGSTAVGAYALLAAWTLPALGLGPGSLVAWTAAAAGVTLPAWWWLRRPRRSPMP